MPFSLSSSPTCGNKWLPLSKPLLSYAADFFIGKEFFLLTVTKSLLKGGHLIAVGFIFSVIVGSLCYNIKQSFYRLLFGAI